MTLLHANRDAAFERLSTSTAPTPSLAAADAAPPHACGANPQCMQSSLIADRALSWSFVFICRRLWHLAGWPPRAWQGRCPSTAVGACSTQARGGTLRSRYVTICITCDCFMHGPRGCRAGEVARAAKRFLESIASQPQDSVMDADGDFESLPSGAARCRGAPPEGGARARCSKASVTRCFQMYFL